MKKSVLIVLLILSAAVLVFVSNDDALYSRQIMKITKIETVKEETSRNSLELNEKHYTRRISGVIQNGSDKGEEKDILYEETYSSVVTDRFRVGDKVFVDGTELELKRDFYLALIVCVFIVLIYMVGSYKGLLFQVAAIVLPLFLLRFLLKSDNYLPFSYDFSSLIRV